MANFLIRTGLSVVLGLSGIAIGHCSTPSVTTIPQSERNVLTALFLSTDGGGWTDSTNWCDKTRCSSGPKFDSPGTECTWFGVTCDGSGAHVTRIALNDNQLSGQIPDLGDLTELVSFDVSGNRLFGAIPTLAGAQKLATFDVGHNQLTGPLPGAANICCSCCFVYFRGARFGIRGAFTPSTQLRPSPRACRQS